MLINYYSISCLLIDLEKLRLWCVSMTHIANLILKQVIFPALDSQVKNVVRAYSLEHSSIDDSFTCIFHYLDLLINKEEDASQTLQELISSVVTAQTVICHHMHKEEEQVPIYYLTFIRSYLFNYSNHFMLFFRSGLKQRVEFTKGLSIHCLYICILLMWMQIYPLLMDKCSPEEQSKLVWRYMCSFPTMLLEEFLHWTTLYLTSYVKLDVLHCIQLMVPKERQLQEVDSMLKLSSNVVKYLTLIINSTGTHFMGAARGFFFWSQQHIWKEASASKWTIQYGHT